MSVRLTVAVNHVRIILETTSLGIFDPSVREGIIATLNREVILGSRKAKKK